MGIGYSSQSQNQTNILSDCTDFEAGPNGTIAHWGDTLEIFMTNMKKDDHTDYWGMGYVTGKTQKKHTCGLHLTASRDNNRVKSIRFELSDSANNETELALDITRVGRDRLRARITGAGCSSRLSFTREKRDHSIETTIVPYGCSFRDGLLVLEMKKKINSDDAYMVTVAHYYVTKDIGLSVAAKVRRNKGHGFVVEVEGPFKHPSADLRKVLVKTRRTGIWSPDACSHCSNRGSNSSLSDDTISQILSRNVRVQSYTGLLNSSGYTDGFLNNCVILIDCKI